MAVEDEKIDDRQTYCLVVEVSPPVLDSMLDPDDREKHVVSVDLSADIDLENKISISLNWIFGRIGLSRSRWWSSARYYLATDGGELRLRILGANLDSCTGNRTIPASYTNRSRQERQMQLKISPKFSGGYKELKVGASLGEITYKKNTVHEFESNISTSEQDLAVQRRSNECTWDFQRPKVDSPLRNYVFGNIFLDANFGGIKDHAVGNIFVQPSGIRVFGQNGELLRDYVRLGTLLELWRRGISSVRRLGEPSIISLRFQFISDEE